ncbi:MAG: cupin domain-containing protein [Proteobacteria bacterium]|nr:MAG: cupin domain-containing protein [Pseudomonadota bacterium]
MKVVTTSKETATPGPAEYFTGKVSVKRLVVGEQPSNLTCGSVEFAAGARSNWHTHPKGQLFIVTNGEGLVQEFGKPIQKIKVGDVVWTPANVKHWHGAGANTSMTHSAVTETSDGKAVEWLERVTDAEYSKAPK